MLLKIIPFAINAHHYTTIEPAVNCLPEWYKSIPLKIDANTPNSLVGSSEINLNMTVKGCVPFLDAMTAGYIVKTVVEIEVVKTDTQVEIRWRSDDVLIATHDLSQIQNVPDKPHTHRDVFKWIFQHQVETPTGYSCLFTQPFNRPDLPFRMYDAIVDTDSHPIPINFPFQVAHNKNASFIVPEGTPIMQIIPFKRESWELQMMSYNHDKVIEGNFAHAKKAIRSYRKQFWHKKSFR